MLIFLTYDRGVDNVDCMMIFASNENLNLLVWLADGTYKSSSSVFYQLFTLHVYISEYVVPVLYALLPNKTKQTYQHILTEVSKLRHFGPEKIITDFEQAVLNAF